MDKKHKSTEPERRRKSRLDFRQLLKWLGPATIGLIGVFVGVFLNQAFLERTSEVEQRAQLRREIIQSQLPYLQKIRRFAEIGGTVSWVVFKNRFYDPQSGEVIAVDKQGIQVFAPLIAYDTTMHKEWIRLGDEIVASRDVINPEVYGVMERVLEFTTDHPMPAEGGLAAIEISDYSNPDVVATWISLNEYLSLKVERLLYLRQD